MKIEKSRRVAESRPVCVATFLVRFSPSDARERVHGWVIRVLLMNVQMRINILRTFITRLLVHIHQKKKIALEIAAKIASVSGS